MYRPGLLVPKSLSRFFYCVLNLGSLLREVPLYYYTLYSIYNYTPCGNSDQHNQDGRTILEVIFK